jgi:2-alkenal reductase
MQTLKGLPAALVLGSLLLSACGAPNIANVAPAANVANGNTTTQSIPVSAPIAAPTSTTPTSTTVLGDVQALQSAYQGIFEKVSPSVVYIQVSQVQTATTNPRSRGQNPQPGTPNTPVPTALGSGFVWDMAGHIVTNNHVIDGADKITVTFADGTVADAKLVGKDPSSDLAVIQVSVPESVLKPIDTADSTRAKVGQLVVAIGNPFGLANTMTTGIVSALARSIESSNTAARAASGATYSIPDIIQTDAAINPGNSGGVLVDLDGRLLGVPTAIESSGGSNSGVGFAVPSAIVKKVVPTLISKGAYQHPWLGITGTTVTPDIASRLNLKANQTGILVIDVASGGPAATAGLKPAATSAQGDPTGGDIIIAVDGKPVQRFEDLVSYLFSQASPGQTLTLTVLRQGKEESIKIILGTQPSA